jgi:flagellar basal-body rod modification protein FlgD
MASVQSQIISNSNYSALARAQQQAQSAANTSSSAVKSQDFLYLLTMQLQYQDPTNPMDNSEMLAQEAQFTTLEQMENLSSSFTKFSNAYQANSLLGQTVEVDVDGKITKGKVDYVDFSDASGASLSIDGKVFPISSVTKVYPEDTTEATEDKNFIKEVLSYIGGNIGAITNALFNENTDSITDIITDSIESEGQ